MPRLDGFGVFAALDVPKVVLGVNLVRTIEYLLAYLAILDALIDFPRWPGIAHER